MARKTRAGSPAVLSIRVRVTIAERAELESVAADLGMPLTAVIREAVDEFVGDYRERVVFRGTKRNNHLTL